VKSIQFPLFDGQMGVLPGRAPAVGRLGAGELKFEAADGGTKHYFVDGGFAQIKGSIVTLLTDRAMPVEQINAATAQAELESAMASHPKDDAGFALKQKSIERARKMISLGRR
jgi:F-type H+-transporting ATPase subunit epsilon